jgi:signal peptidase
MTGIAVPLPPASPPRLLRTTTVLAGAVLLGLAAAAIVVAVIATRFFDYHILTVSSGSMAPALRTGDLIVVRPAPIDRVREGDIVLFESGGDGIPTVHRVIGVNTVETRITDRATGAVERIVDYRLVTKGDNNPAPDSQEVTAAHLRGELWFTIPGAGAFLGAGLATWAGLVFIAAIAGWAAWEVVARVRRHVRGAAS